MPYYSSFSQQVIELFSACGTHTDWELIVCATGDQFSREPKPNIRAVAGLALQHASGGHRPHREDVNLLSLACEFRHGFVPIHLRLAVLE
jgi:hypothetical protein